MDKNIGNYFLFSPHNVQKKHNILLFRQNESKIKLIFLAFEGTFSFAVSLFAIQ